MKTNLVFAFHKKKFIFLLDSPLSLGGGIGFPPTLESLLPQPDSAFHLGDLGIMIKKFIDKFINRVIG